MEKENRKRRFWALLFYAQLSMLDRNGHWSWVNHGIYGSGTYVSSNRTIELVSDYQYIYKESTKLKNRILEYTREDPDIAVQFKEREEEEKRKKKIY